MGPISMVTIMLPWQPKIVFWRFVGGVLEVFDDIISLLAVINFMLRKFWLPLDSDILETSM